MKLIITGATGFTGRELVKQALGSPKITTVVAISRRPLSAEQGAGHVKLRNVIVKDYDEYTESTKQELAGANACIWTVAILPGKASSYSADELKRVCQTSTMNGFRAMYEAGPAKPFRFIYMCGQLISRDPANKPFFQGEYGDLRGETENQVLAFAAEHKSDGVEAIVTKSGFITGPGYFARNLFANTLDVLKVGPAIRVEDIATAMLDQVINGFDKDPLTTTDLLKIAKRARKASAGASDV